MEKEVFRQHYSDNIQLFAQKLVEDNPEMSLEYHENFIGVYQEYLNQKTLLKKIIKEGSVTEEDSLLDRHKIAACVTCAIIKTRLLTDSNIEDIKSRDGIRSDSSYFVETSRMNEQLAILSGLNILLQYMKEDDRCVNTDGQQLEEPILILFPETSYPERSSYLDSLVRGLYYSNLFTVINPLLVAHIFYFIEKYHRQGIELLYLKACLEKKKIE